MLHRIHQLIEDNVDFAFETTLSTKSYVSLIKNAQQRGYVVTLLFFWLNSSELAKQRVAKRVSKGGHNIPADIIERRYKRGIFNLINLYISVCDNWMVVNNMNISPDPIAQGGGITDTIIRNTDIWNTILEQSKQYGK